jgi:hypothetical protein
MILRPRRLPGQPLTSHDIDNFCWRAALQGEAWARLGFDVNQRIRQHAPFWPGSRQDRVRLILATLEGAKRAGGRA